MTAISTPEPAPKAEGENVPNALIAALHNMGASGNIRGALCNTTGALSRAIEMVRERDLFGRAKYGQPLMTGDGRDSANDAAQELVDAMQYVQKANMNGESLGTVRELYAVLGLLLAEHKVRSDLGGLAKREAM